MNIAKICYEDTVNGDGFRTSIFLSGCNKYPKCKDCWNKDLWSFQVGDKYTEETKDKILNSLSKPYVKGLSILGGEPMDNLTDGELIDLVKNIKYIYPKKTIYVWSGYYLENIIKKEEVKEFLKYVDMLRDGEFILELKDVNQYLQGSKNQRYVDVQHYLKTNLIRNYFDYI